MSSFDRTERVTHIIDSTNRSSGTNENFTITLTEPLIRVKKVEVVTVEIPYTFYVVNTNNNIVDFENAGGTPLQATLDQGNYSGTSFAAHLVAKLDALYAGWTILYSSNTYKIRFQHTGNFELKSSGTASALLGLVGDSGVTTDFTAPGISNLSGPNYVLIRSDTLTRPMKNRPLLGVADSDVLYKMTIQTGPGTTLIEKNVFPNPYVYPVRQTLTTIDFQLQDPDGNLLDLNGQRWSLTLVFDIL